MMETTNILLRRLPCSGCVLFRSQQARRETWLLAQRARRCSTTAKRKVQTRMKAWQIHQYGGNEEFALSDMAKIPNLKSPSDVLVEVHAASVNPIDVAMRGGYGKNMINQLRRQFDGVRDEFPLTLGRDFSGVIRETGHAVTRFKKGDEEDNSCSLDAFVINRAPDKVWGALGAHRQGTHAQFAVAGEREISKKPRSVSHVEAASIPYVATTTWAALCTTGGLSESNTKSSRLLIHGGSGGVGSFAIQLTKAWGAHVTSTCATDAIELVESLGTDHVIDYRTSDVAKELRNIEKVDLILDTVGGDTDTVSADALKPWTNSKYVTLVMPLLSNTDQSGIGAGMLQSMASLGLSTVKGFTRGRSYRWAFFIPNGNALEKVARLVDSGKIRPIVEKVFSFDQLPEVYNKVGQKHGRGKSVIDLSLG